MIYLKYTSNYISCLRSNLFVNNICEFVYMWLKIVKFDAFEKNHTVMVNRLTELSLHSEDISLSFNFVY